MRPPLKRSLNLWQTTPAAKPSEYFQIPDSCHLDFNHSICHSDTVGHQLKTLTVRLDENFHRRLKAKLLSDNTNFQAKAQALLESYVEGPPEQREVIERQVAIAREAMRRYAPAMRELAR